MKAQSNLDQFFLQQIKPAKFWHSRMITIQYSVFRIKHSQDSHRIYICIWIGYESAENSETFFITMYFVM